MAIPIIIIMTMIINISSIINMILAQKMINWVYAINSDPLFSSAGSSWWCICLSSQCLLYNPFVIFISIILITITISINSSPLQPFVIIFVRTLMIIMMISSLKEGNLLENGFFQALSEKGLGGGWGRPLLEFWHCFKNCTKMGNSGSAQHKPFFLKSTITVLMIKKVL